jgi:hypothetical protein
MSETNILDNQIIVDCINESVDRMLHQLGKEPKHLNKESNQWKPNLTIFWNFCKSKNPKRKNRQTKIPVPDSIRHGDFLDF